MLIEVIFIVGPLVVAVFAATAAPALAVWFSAGCALVGTLVFLRSPALQGWRIERRSATGLLGPLARRDFAHLIAIVLCFATAFGFLEIGITAYAVETSDAALAGVLLGLMSAGSALGGLAYGSRAWHAPLARQFACAALATLAVCGLVAISRGRDCARLDYSIHARHEDCGDRALHRGFHMDDERPARWCRDRTCLWRHSARAPSLVGGVRCGCGGGAALGRRCEVFLRR